MKKLMFLFLATTCVPSGIFGVRENENTENNKDNKEYTPIEKKAKKPTTLTIATFSLAMNSVLGFMTQTLGVSWGQSFLIFLSANFGIQEWYKSKLVNKFDTSDQKDEKIFGFKLKPYCEKTHWYIAMPSYLLSSAFAYKIMNFGSRRASKYQIH